MPWLRDLLTSCAPTFATMCDEPYWACAYWAPHPTDPVQDVRFEFWLDQPFASWFPVDWPNAIITATPATALSRNDCAGTGRDRRRWRPGPRTLAGQCRLLCAVDDDGDAYAVLAFSDGRRVQGQPAGGLLLDAIRAKFFLPPGPASPYALDV